MSVLNFVVIISNVDPLANCGIVDVQIILCTQFVGIFLVCEHVILCISFCHVAAITTITVKANYIG